MSYVGWLPDLVIFRDYDNNWDRYLEALYKFYKKDFIYSKPIFCDKRLGIKKNPYYNNKEATFWHIIQEGKKEDERTPDLRRCERIRWPKPIIEHRDKIGIKIWENIRHKKKGIQHSICIWFKDAEYLVILRKRSSYILFWTAYPVTENHRKRKLEKEYQEYKKGKERFK